MLRCRFVGDCRWNFANDEEHKDIDVVLEKLEVFCVGKTNEIYKRYQFNKRDQESGESIDSYVASLCSLTKTCNYGSLSDSLIRDRIVVGIRYNGTRKRLLEEAKLAPNKCIDICRSSESTSARLPAMGNQEDLKFVADDKIKKETQDKGGKAAISCTFCGKTEACQKYRRMSRIGKKL